MREDCRIAKNVFKMCQNFLQLLSAHSHSIRNIIMPFLWHKAERVGLHLSWGCCRNGQQHRIKSQKVAKERGWARTMCESSITSLLFLCGLQSPSMCRLWFALKLGSWWFNKHTGHRFVSYRDIYERIKQRVFEEFPRFDRKIRDLQHRKT